ncbi:Uncharacterised protein [Streptococcus pneumoniae]|nr:Uncharacterised protein [Streptococcus pneumoniae]
MSCQKGCGISDFIDKTACNKRHFKDSNEYWWSFMAYFFIRKYFFIKYCRSIKKYVIKISIVMEVVLIYTRIVNSNTILYCIQVCHCQVEKIAITHFYTLLLRLLVNGLTQ